MAFTKESEYKKEVLPNGVIQVRRADLVKEDGVEIARTFHRHVLVPGDDVSKEPECVKAIANAVWTPAVVSAYAASVESAAA